jgi:methyl-accepting chemotaxis protein
MRPSATGIRISLTAIALTAVCGCPDRSSDSPSVVSQTSQAAGKVIRLEPTGTIDRNAKIGEAADTVKDRVEQIDVEGFNAAVVEIKRLIDVIRLFVETIPPDLGATVATKIEGVELDTLSVSLEKLAEESTRKVAKFDPEAINLAVADIRKVAADVADRVSRIDVEAGNRLIADAAQVSQSADDLVQRSTALIERLQQTVDALPTAEVRESARGVQSVTADLSPIMGQVRVALWLVIALTAALIVCALTWILRTVRR